MFSTSFLSLHVVYFFFLSSPEPIVFRLAFENPEASNYHQNPREVSSTHSSPYKTLPRPPREPHSMPPTPVMTRNSYSSSHLRCDLHSSALSLRSLLFNLQSPASVVEVAATVCFFRPVQDSNSNLSYTLSPLFQWCMKENLSGMLYTPLKRHLWNHFLFIFCLCDVLRYIMFLSFFSKSPPSVSIYILYLTPEFVS